MGIVTNQNEIDNYVREFRERLRPLFARTVNTIVGHPHRSWKQEVWWSDQLGMWMCYSDEGDKVNKRYFTLFGLQEPISDENTPINAEINFPSILSKSPNSIQGAFDKKLDGGILIIHRGCINVGRGRIPTQDFLTKYEQYGGRTTWLTPIKGRPKKKAAIVAELDSLKLAKPILDYVTRVHKIKSLYR
jgi:hypothetical protein